MSKMPWVQFYPSDWLAGTRGMTASETGIYITLIATMYERCEPLTEDVGRLSRLCGASPSAFKNALNLLIEDGKIERVDGVLQSPLLKSWDALRGRTPVPSSTRAFVYERDGKICAYCGDENGPFHIDHIFPIALGGDNSPSNLTVACQPCNLSKGAKTLGEWRQ